MGQHHCIRGAIQAKAQLEDEQVVVYRRQSHGRTGNSSDWLHYALQQAGRQADRWMGVSVCRRGADEGCRVQGSVRLGAGEATARPPRATIMHPPATHTPAHPARPPSPVP